MEFNSTFPSWARNGLFACGAFNILLAIMHLLGLFWAEAVFHFTGFEQIMKDLSTIDPVVPYVLVAIVAGFFVLFGLIVISAAGRVFRFYRAPEVAIAIGVIFVLRGLVGMSTAFAGFALAGLGLETLFGLIALAVGLGIIFFSVTAIKHRKPLGYDSDHLD